MLRDLLKYEDYTVRVRTSETSVYFKETKRRNISEGYKLYTRCRENLESHLLKHV
jgi:hypothetical protein